MIKDYMIEGKLNLSVLSLKSGAIVSRIDSLGRMETVVGIAFASGRFFKIILWGDSVPYLASKELRKKIDEIVKKAEPYVRSDGSLNYFLTKLFLLRVKNTNMSYSLAKSFIGEIECFKLELYRKQIGPYENEKEEQNGSVEWIIKSLK